MILDLFRFLVLPSNIILVCISSGLLCLIHPKTKRLSLNFFLLGSGFFFVFGSGPISYWLLSRLEYKYPALISIEHGESIDTIVVLAGYVVNDKIIPLSNSYCFTK